MPQVYSDIEVSAKVVVTDMDFYANVLSDLGHLLSTTHEDVHALRAYYEEMIHSAERLDSMGLFPGRALEEIHNMRKARA